ncbi:hypothetical protein [Streptomyces sp. NPDC002547]
MGDVPADAGPDRFGRFFRHGIGEAVEVLDSLTGVEVLSDLGFWSNFVER